MPRFTPATARQMAALSVAKRRAAETERAASLASATLPATLPADTGQGIDLADSRARKLERLETQLEALDNLIDTAKTADEWHKLWTAKHRLLENYYVLAGIAKPGSRRPGREREQSSGWSARLVPQVPSAPVRPQVPTPAPTAPQTPRSAPSVGPVPIEIALPH